MVFGRPSDREVGEFMKQNEGQVREAEVTLYFVEAGLPVSMELALCILCRQAAATSGFFSIRFD